MWIDRLRGTLTSSLAPLPAVDQNWHARRRAGRIHCCQLAGSGRFRRFAVAPTTGESEYLAPPPFFGRWRARLESEHGRASHCRSSALPQTTANRGWRFFRTAPLTAWLELPGFG